DASPSRAGRPLLVLLAWKSASPGRSCAVRALHPSPQRQQGWCAPCPAADFVCRPLPRWVDSSERRGGRALNAPFPICRRSFLAGGLPRAGPPAWRAAPAASPAAEKRRKNRCVFLFLFGGPSHIDLWDMKPDAPDLVRGEFSSIATSVPGVRVCEHLPRF